MESLEEVLTSDLPRGCCLLLMVEASTPHFSAAFFGKMIWHSFNNIRGATLKINGEYITDFGDAVEQHKWSYHPDYKIGDRSGTWLKWTETEIIVGRGYTVNGWYYAHIRDDKTMVAIYYYNADETVPSSDHFTFTLVQP